MNRKPIRGVVDDGRHLGQALVPAVDSQPITSLPSVSGAALDLMPSRAAQCSVSSSNAARIRRSSRGLAGAQHPRAMDACRRRDVSQVARTTKRTNAPRARYAICASDREFHVASDLHGRIGQPAETERPGSPEIGSPSFSQTEGSRTVLLDQFVTRHPRAYGYVTLRAFLIRREPPQHAARV